MTRKIMIFFVLLSIYFSYMKASDIYRYLFINTINHIYFQDATFCSLPNCICMCLATLSTEVIFC